MTPRIVVINNDLLMQKVFVMSLGDRGWDISTYRYDEIRLASLSQLHPGLLILDFKESNIEAAWEFLQMLKMDDTTANIPVLITTVLDVLTAEIRGFLALQNIQIVYMPFVPESFVKLIHYTLDFASDTGLSISHDKSLPILVVEDHELLREALVEILRLEGYQVVTANNGLLALNIVYKFDHSLIFLDIQMPVMDGFEFLKIYGKQLRQHRPVIVLSADSSIRSHIFPKCVVALLPKPYEVDSILTLAEKYSKVI